MLTGQGDTTHGLTPGCPLVTHNHLLFAPAFSGLPMESPCPRMRALLWWWVLH
jgi:hypothetical protein